MRVSGAAVAAGMVVVILLLAACAGPAPTSLKPPAAAPDHPVARPQAGPILPALPIKATSISNGKEPSILASRDGKAIWMGDTTGFYASFNNGTTWEHEKPLPVDLSADGWTIAEDQAGGVYTASTNTVTVDVAKSTDQGKTWGTVASYGASAYPVTDRPWLAAHGSGDVVLVTNNLPFEWCTHSTDGGTTWTDRSPIAGSPIAGGIAYDDEGNFVFADPDGTVHRGPTCLNLQSQAFVDGAGVNNQLQVAAIRNEVYLAVATEGSAKVTLVGSKSFENAKSIVVSPPELKSNTYATVTAWGDQVAVGWYGSTTAGDPSAQGYGGKFDVYVTVVSDFWGKAQTKTFKVTKEPNHVGQICMGGITGCDGQDRDLLDYWGMDFDKWGGLHLAYGRDGDGTVAEVMYVHLPPQSFDPEAAPEPTPTVEPGPEEVPTSTAVTAPPPTDDAQTARASFSANVVGLRLTADGSDSKGTAPLHFAWQFGDGAAGEGAKVSHTYDANGTYQIQLVVTDGSGSRSTATGSVTVVGGAHAAPPTTKAKNKSDAASATILIVGVTALVAVVRTRRAA